MKLIVGLGNPGNQYKYTRHNLGFLVVDRICKNLNLTLNKSKFNGEYVKLDDFILAKPLTYMNLSGQFISQICSYFKIKPQDVLVIHDEKDFELGKASLKNKGSGGSHNGVKNIIEQLGSDNFKRLRIGINAPFQGELRDFVLGTFTEKEMITLDSMIDSCANVAISFVYNDINILMNKFNQLNNGKK
ncbi:aminoacyl-tRNA hydrolase [Mycoplasmopsis felis]|uniref:aminoacyl-tRNA hydrolase n=1 Tax=Mycoplasmopsis felis TaxID=33923 RepID=UPI002AFE3181|nr:aminoacyl-tRNA hydrolase [Mycoplasmopsis felis]WQQ10929.1 aminoacyl-tRNA hydrolase [Mycoplasmopsis felis]